jgi:hypothetical protein
MLWTIIGFFGVIFSFWFFFAITCYFVPLLHRKNAHSKRKVCAAAGQTRRKYV